MTELRLRSARGAILDTLPEDTSLFGGSVESQFVHVPNGHAKALHPDSQLVVGMRGAGKSFWWSTLQAAEKRHLIAERAPLAKLTESTQIAVGFGEEPNPSAYPSRDVLELLIQDHEPRTLWRTVIATSLAGEQLQRLGDWRERVGYVQEHPEQVDRILFERDAELSEQDSYWIMLFDALDRSAGDWSTMNRLIRGLLEAALDLRPYRRLRVKCFLRTDQLVEREVGNFPDASKILAGRVDLSWPATELYNLLFQYLGNSESGDFRSEIEEELRWKWQSSGSIWIPPAELYENQREVFHSICGPWMGKDRRRGFPFTWVPNHLADAEGRTSPRSFIAALRKAAEDTKERYKGHGWSLHYESLKRGVQRASEIRVKELQEDYPWIEILMSVLRGRVVPLEFDQVAEAWRSEGVLEKLRNRVEEGTERLPPARLEEDDAGVRRDLEDLGIFLRLRDGRVNIPDVYRVGYGLGRRGGVRPVRP